MMAPIRHIVMWRVSGDTPDERAAARRKVKAAFDGLKGRIAGLNHVEVGLDISGVDYACDVVLITEFASRADLDAYATHPEHLRVREELANLRIARFQVDYEVDCAVDDAAGGTARRPANAARDALIAGE